VALYQQAANNNDGFSQARLGRMYIDGHGVSRDLTEAAKWYQKAIEQLHSAADDGAVIPMINLARLLATCDVPELRDGRAAVNLGEKAVAATGRKSSAALDALAAAYAETGQFDKAAATQNEAIANLSSEEDKQPLEARAKLYEAKKPCRDSEQTD
jgi:TPR repeat protein